MFLKEFEFNLKSFLADFKFHHSNGKKRSKTVNSKKWENKFKFKLEYDIANQKVFRLCQNQG